MFRLVCEEREEDCVLSFHEEGSTSYDLLIVMEEDVGDLLALAKIATDRGNQTPPPTGDLFTFFTKSAGATFILSVKVTDHWYKGYEFSNRAMRMLISELETTLDS